MWLGRMNHAVLQSKVYLTNIASYRRWLGLFVVANYASTCEGLRSRVV